MKVALIGATGNVGSRILAELLSRGHTVTAIARNPEKVPARPGVAPKRGDVHDKAGLAPLLAGHDSVISAVRFSASDPHLLIAAVKEARVPRYLVVGGAGSLEVAPGQKLIDTPNFPAAYKPEASRVACFSGFCAARRISTGRSCRRPRLLGQGNAPANSALAATSFLPPPTARAAFRTKITPSPSSTNSRSPPIRDSASPWVTETGWIYAGIHERA